MTRIENIVFWILIALIIGIAIWKLFGSPTDTAALISIALFVAASEILLWRALFLIDKKTSIGFLKIKIKLTNTENNFNNKLDNLDNKLNNIENLIRGRK